MYRLVSSVVLVVYLMGGQVNAQDATAMAESETALRATGKAYIDAFNKQDAKAVAAFWSPEAVYTNRQTGEQTIGLDSIADSFAALFEDSPNLKLEVSVGSIQFVSPNVAIEQGTATFLLPDSEPELTDYSAVYVKHDGKWLLDRVMDQPNAVIKSNAQHLKQLEWMIGSWIDSDENVTVETECNWTKNRNYIARQFAISVGDQIELSGMQIIGWDSAAGQVRSWTFDSDGGFSQGIWSNSDDRWYIRKSGTTAEGEAVTAVNIVTKVSDDAFKLQSIERTVAGKLLPNVDEVLVVRQ